ncbi:MAG: FAD-dependent oxidoreductase [Acidobacteriota bacterium]
MSRPTPGIDFAIVGGGIIGLACARALARRGATVAVLERGALGSGSGDGEASAASAGMLAPLAEAPDPGGFSTLCRTARDLWSSWAPELEDESGLRLDYDRSGALLVDEDSGHERLRASARRHGEPFETIDPRSARRLVPDLAEETSLLLLPGEHRVDPRRVCSALEATLERVDGGRVRRLPGHLVRRIETKPQGVELHGLELNGLELHGLDEKRSAPHDRQASGAGFRLAAGHAIVAAGAWSGTIQGLPSLPLTPIRGQMLRLDDIDWPFTGTVRGSSLYAVRRPADGSAGSGLLVGATVEEDAGFDARCTPDGLAQLVDWLRRWLPGTLQRPLRTTWAGLRPAVPDHRPVLGAVSSLGDATDGARGLDRVWLATAHHRNGILLAPWTAERLAEALIDDLAPPDIVSPRRLRGDSTAILGPLRQQPDPPPADPS